MKGLIYKITNKVNGKVYIGLTRYTLEFRWRLHLHKKDNTYFHNAIRKYGAENFLVEVLEECDIKDLDSREIFYIAKYDSFKNGYNLTIGGSGNRKLIIDNKYDEIRELYLSGFSSSKIATLFKVDSATIIKILKSLDVKIKNNRLNINNLELLEVIKDYLSGVSLKQLAKRYNCSGPALKEFLIRKGVDIKLKYSILNSEEDLQNMINDYLGEELKLSEIQAKYHCSYSVFCKVLSSHGISRGKKHFKLKEKECLEVIRLFNEGMTIPELSKKFEVNKCTIYSLLKRYHVNYLKV